MNNRSAERRTQPSQGEQPAFPEHDRLRFATYGSGDGLWDVDMAGASVVVSRTLQLMLGMEGAAGPIPFQPLSAFHGDDARRMRRAAIDHLRGRTERIDEECRVRHASGSFIWMHVRGSRAPGTDPAILHLTGAITDITDRKRSQETLAACEQLRGGLFDSASDAIIVMDPAGVIQFANPATRAVFGQRPEDLVGRLAWVLQPQRFRSSEGQLAEQDWVSRMLKPCGEKHHGTGLRRDGTEFPGEMVCSEIVLPQGRMVAAFCRDMTRWEQARADLERAKLLLDATQELALVGGWEVNFSDEKVHWTDYMFRMLETSPGEYQPTWADFLHFVAPDHLERVKSAVSAAVGDKQVNQDLEHEFVSARGKRIFVQHRIRITVEGGRVLRLSGTVRDLTQQRNVEAARRDASEAQRAVALQLDAVMAGAQIALWTFEVSTGKVLTAHGWDRLLGRASMPADTASWNELVHPDDLAQAVAIREQHLRGELPQVFAEYRMRHADGRWIHVRSQGKVSGRVADGLLQYTGAVADVTHEAAAREVVQTQRKMLEAVVEGVDVGLMVIIDGGVAFANSALAQMLGYEAGTHMKGVRVEDLLTPGDQAHSRRRQASMAEGHAEPVWITKLVTVDGSLHPVALSSSAIASDGQILFITAVNSLTEHDLLEAQIRATQARYERTLVSELETLQATIAGELHDSLGSHLAGLVMHLGEAGRLAAGAPLAARKIEDAIRQVARAAESTRALARGLMPVADHPGAFWHALEQLAADINTLKNISCEFHIEGDLDDVPADVGNHLFRIAQEAANNAMRHGGATDLRFSVDGTGEVRFLRIEDNGRGFDVDLMDADHPGLGLRSMHARVKAINGSMEVRSTDGGSVIEVKWARSYP